MATKVTDFSYMGKQITITEDRPNAVINIDGRVPLPSPHADRGKVISMCDGAMTWVMPSASAPTQAGRTAGLCRRHPVLGSRTIDVALRSHHRLVTEQLHEGVHAYVLVGQFGGERVPETVNEDAAGAFAVESSFLERAQHPVLQCAAG
jgi:hypothetical protein